MNIQAVATAAARPAVSVWTNQHSSPAELSPPVPQGLRAAAGISRVGEVFGRLSSLQQSDPEKLKSTAGEIAAALKSEAGNQTGGAAQAYGKLATAFEQVAQTGDLSSLEPPRAPQARGQTGGPSPYGPPGGQPGGDPQALAQAMGVVAQRLGVG